MKNKRNIIKQENKKLIEILESEIGELILFIFYGKGNYVFPENIPFEFTEPQLGVIKEDRFTATRLIYSYTPKEMKETLENSELKIEVDTEELLGSIKTLEKAGYIEEINVYVLEKAKRYAITEKGYMLTQLLSYNLKYPGQSKRESHRQF